MQDNKGAVDVDIERYERIRPFLSRLVWAGPCPNAETVTTILTSRGGRAASPPPQAAGFRRLIDMKAAIRSA